VVIAVTLVMAALAVSAYRTYSVRGEVRAAVAAVAQVQDLVTDAFGRTGMPPVSERDVPGMDGATPRHRSVEAVAITHGRIEIRFGNDADESLRGQSLYVAPFETMDGEVLWLCGNRPPDVGLYRLGLFGGAPPPPPLATTVEPRYLPSECR
jgi:type IV pilus assembly protein PilA